MGLMMKNVKIMAWEFTGKSNFQGGVTKNQYMGKLPKKGLGQFADLRGGWQKRGGGVFQGTWKFQGY